MQDVFHQIKIDFEYLNEIYTVNSEPYNTLFELKETVSKKIFPHPGIIHCFYKNIDLFEKEDDEISKIFPNQTKIKIQLKRPQKNKSKNKPYLSRNNQIKLALSENIENSPKNETYHRKEKSKTIRKKPVLLSLPSIKSDIFKLRQGCDIYDNLIGKSLENSNKKSSLFNQANKKNVIEEYSKKKQIDNKNNEKNIGNLMNNYKDDKTISKNLKDFDDITVLLSNLKSKNFKEYKLFNKKNLKFNKIKDSYNKDNKIINTDRISYNKNLENLNISSDDIKPEIKDENNEINDKDNIDNIDENYICNSCKKNKIYEYCLTCNEFKCHSCIELCKDDSHELMKIDLNEDCLKNIFNYGNLIINKIDNNFHEVKKFDKELQIYDIKKRKDDLVSYINDIINIYSEIIIILENIYKENYIKKEMDKYEKDSNKIKGEINDILHKANSYLKNEDISNPKYKMINLKHFFDLLNEKGKSYHLINQNIKIYSLNTAINSSVQKCFNEMENLMKPIININNPFSLKDDLIIVYRKLLEKSNNSKKDKKKLFMKRRTIQLNAINLPNFPPSGVDKTSDNTNNKLLNL